MRKALIKTAAGVEEITAYTVAEMDLSRIEVSEYRSNRPCPSPYFGTYDIETTSYEGDQDTPRLSFMYHWQACIAGTCVYGRYWSEWEELIQTISEHFRCDEKHPFIMYVHNLGYEYQYMKHFLRRLGDYELFAPQPRKPLSVRTSLGIEFRCSYKLTNMSLEHACKFEKCVKYLKQAGDLDYRKLRFPWTPLDNTEFSYCIGDVVSQYDMIKCRMANHGDNTRTIPLTSTAYVRRDMRKSCRQNQHYRDFYRSLRLTKPVYTLLKKTARGGDTHANRYMAGKEIPQVDSYDIQSSYPYQMCTKQYPISSFTYYGELDSITELEDLLSSKACLFRIILTKVELKNNSPFPYIPSDKCESYRNPVFDNGRILSADMIDMTITDIDYKIISDQYKWEEIYISDMHTAEYGYLPDCITSVILEYFTNKTKYKAISQANPDDRDAEYYKDRSKNEVNSTFGMMYTDPIRDLIVELDSGKWKRKSPDLDEELERYNKNPNAFLYYAWGVWTTAHARYQLHELRSILGEHNGIYQDTDSFKGVNFEHSKIAEENARIIEIDIARKAYAEYNGERAYLGIFDHETSKGAYETFITLGAKKYAYVEQGKLKVTVSGVNKTLAPYELGSIHNFRPGFVFHSAGGLKMTYLENGIINVTIRGNTFETASGIYTEDGTYELGITDEYEELIGYDPYSVTDDSIFFY